MQKYKPFFYLQNNFKKNLSPPFALPLSLSHLRGGKATTFIYYYNSFVTLLYKTL